MRKDVEPESQSAILSPFRLFKISPWFEIGETFFDSIKFLLKDLRLLFVSDRLSDNGIEIKISGSANLSAF